MIQIEVTALNVLNGKYELELVCSCANGEYGNMKLWPDRNSERLTFISSSSLQAAFRSSLPLSKHLPLLLIWACSAIQTPHKTLLLRRFHCAYIKQAKLD